MNQGLRIGLTGLLLAAGWMLAANTAQAASFMEAYIPPEVVYAHDLNQKIAMPRKVNVNTASLPELETIPGLSENLALKLMRLRPLKNFEDFREVPWFSPREIQLLIDTLHDRIEF